MTASARIAGTCLALLAIAAVYTHRLGDSPAYLSLDEAHFGNHAYSLATTGRDLNGNRMPAFVSLDDPQGEPLQVAWGSTWYHPYGFYVIATSLVFFPLSEWSIRLPFALIGLLNVVLIGWVARRWYASRVAGLIAATLLALTPAHFILTRMALDYVLPLPFALAWLLALWTLLHRPDRRSACITGLILGAGCLSYVSSWLLMPIYLAITMILTWRTLRRSDLLAPLLAGFVVALLPLTAWLMWHPGVPGTLLAQYQAGETHRSVLTALAQRRDVAAALRDALAAYWSYFDPSFLFVSGGASRLVSTGVVGVWPIGVAVLLLKASVDALGGRWPWQTAIIVVGFLVAPIPAALKGEPFAIQRAVTMLPFGVLLATAALAAPSRRSLGAAVSLAALLFIPWEFGGFVSHYFSAYRTQSAHALDPTSFREAADALIEHDRPGMAQVILLPSPLYDAGAKWRFYVTERGRADLLQRTRYFSGDPSDIGSAPAGSLAVVESSRAVDGHTWRVIASPEDITGATPLRVVERQ